MNGAMRFVSSLVTAISISAGLTAQTTVSASSSAISQHELKKEIARAHTSEQYSMLANYFLQQEKVFRDKASEEKAEWERRKQVTISLGVKYPSPADSARNLYTYYDSRANQMARRVAEYEGHATTEGVAGAK